MLYAVNDALIVIFEVICCELLYGTFNTNDESNKGKKKNVIITAGLSALLFAVVKLLSGQFVIKQIAVIFLILAIMKMTYDISWAKSTALACLFQGLLVTVEYLAYFIVQILAEDVTNMNTKEELLSRLIAAIDLILLFIIILALKRRFQKYKNWLMRDEEWIRFIIFPVLSLMAISGIIKAFNNIDDADQMRVLYMIAFGLVIMNFFVFYLLDDIVKKSEVIRESEIYSVQSKNQLEMYNMLAENLDRQRSRTHEFNNHLLCINALVKNQKYEELKEYISDICQNSQIDENVINTNNVMVNTIINIKYSEAVGKGIVFVVRVNDLSKINIKNEDLVILLSNLLNNAIEACEKCENKRVIKMKFMIENEDIILSVKNTYNEPIIKRGESFVTAKKEKSDHGIGIKNVIKVVEKYKGTYAIQNKTEEFMFSIMIPLIYK